MGQPKGEQTLAARIVRELDKATIEANKKRIEQKKKAKKKGDDEEEDEGEPVVREKLHVIYVADIDIFHDFFLQMRARPNDLDLASAFVLTTPSS